MACDSKRSKVILHRRENSRDANHDTRLLINDTVDATQSNRSIRQLKLLIDQKSKLQQCQSIRWKIVYLLQKVWQLWQRNKSTKKMTDEWEFHTNMKHQPEHQRPHDRRTKLMKFQLLVERWKGLVKLCRIKSEKTTNEKNMNYDKSNATINATKMPEFQLTENNSMNFECRTNEITNHTPIIDPM